MIKKMAGDALGEILETGKATARHAKQVSPAKVIHTASEQISSNSKGSSSARDEDLQSSKPSSSQLIKNLKQADNKKSQVEVDQTKLTLNRLIMQRYQTMQQDIRKKQAEREQEEEEKKQAAMKEKTEQQQEQKGLSRFLPKRKKTKGPGIFTKQKKGSREMKLGKMG